MPFNINDCKIFYRELIKVIFLMKEEEIESFYYFLNKKEDV